MTRLGPVLTKEKRYYNLPPFPIPQPPKMVFYMQQVPVWNTVNIMQLILTKLVFYYDEGSRDILGDLHRLIKMVTNSFILFV